MPNRKYFYWDRNDGDYISCDIPSFVNPDGYYTMHMWKELSRSESDLHLVVKCNITITVHNPHRDFIRILKEKKYRLTQNDSILDVINNLIADMKKFLLDEFVFTDSDMDALNDKMVKEFEEFGSKYKRNV